MGKKICDSGARVEVEEAIDDELQKARFIHCDGLFSTKYFFEECVFFKKGDSHARTSSESEDLLICAFDRLRRSRTL